MRSCLHSVSLPDVPVIDVLARAKEAGYQAVELNAETLPWARPHVTPETSATKRAEIAEAVGKLGLSLPALGAHIPMVDADRSSREEALTFVLGCIDLARDLDIPVVHILSGPLPSGVDKEEAWPWFADAVTTAAARATDYRITIGIEAIAGHMFCMVDDYHRLRLDLPEVPFRVNFDPSHLIVQGEDPLRVVNELADQIVHVHLKDGAGRFPDFTFPPLGQGQIDFQAITKGLYRAGYAGALSVEYEAQVYGYKLSDEEILQSGLDFLSGLGAT